MIISKLIKLHKKNIFNKFFIYKLKNLLHKKIILTDLFKIFLSFKKNKIFILKNTVLLNNILNNLDFISLNGDKLVNFILNIKIVTNNIYFNLTDIKGNTIFVYTVASVVQHKRDFLREKKQLQKLLINMLKVFINKTRHIQKTLLAIHFTGTRIFQETLIINSLKKAFIIKYIKSFNFNPHNGCRPKKVRKVKRRTKKRIRGNWRND